MADAANAVEDLPSTERAMGTQLQTVTRTWVSAMELRQSDLADDARFSAASESRTRLLLQGRARARFGVPPAPPYEVGPESASSDPHCSWTHSNALRASVGPHIVADISEVIAWMNACPGGEDINDEPHSSRRPRRLALSITHPPPFVISATRSSGVRPSGARWHANSRDCEHSIGSMCGSTVSLSTLV